MPEARMSTLMGEAVDTGTALAAFNVITLEHAEGIIAGAERAGRPIVLQLSENAVRHHRGQVAPITAALHAAADAAEIPVVLHMDHVEDSMMLHQAELVRFTSIMVDAGRLPYEQNVEETASAVQWLHGVGIFVEAELGYVGGKDTQVSSAHAPGVRTDPRQAADYVRATGVDSLAVAVGSSHAMTTQTAALDLDLIAAIADAVPVPLVLHGSSGVPDDLLRRAVGAGIRKVNIGTALNVAFTGALRGALAADDGVDPRPPLAAARQAVADKVGHFLRVLND